MNINPLIDEKLLINYGAKLRDIKKGELITGAGEQPEYVNVISGGSVKVCYFNDEGREFTLVTFGPGEIFGHSSALVNQPYETSAYATEISKIWFIKRDDFIKLLQENTELMYTMLVDQAVMVRHFTAKLSEMAVEDAQYRLTTLMNYYKQKRGLKKDQEYVVPLTRQQLADMTGLRVETVIRTIKSMEQKGLLEIIEGKIFWTPKQSVGLPVDGMAKELA
jgi:CRP-like cAMP-binding protein